MLLGQHAWRAVIDAHSLAYSIVRRRNDSLRAVLDEQSKYKRLELISLAKCKRLCIE